MSQEDFLDFLSNYRFSVNSPLALCREAKSIILSLLFIKRLHTYILHKPVREDFLRNRVIVTRTNDQWQADLVDISSLARFSNGYKFLVTCIDVFSKFAWVVPLKNKTGESPVSGFQSILDLGRSLEKLQTDKGTDFLHHKQRIKGKCGRTFQSHPENSYVAIFCGKE